MVATRYSAGETGGTIQPSHAPLLSSRRSAESGGSEGVTDDERGLARIDADRQALPRCVSLARLAERYVYIRIRVLVFRTKTRACVPNLTVL